MKLKRALMNLLLVLSVLLGMSARCEMKSLVSATSDYSVFSSSISQGSILSELRDRMSLSMSRTSVRAIEIITSRCNITMDNVLLRIT